VLDFHHGLLADRTAVTREKMKIAAGGLAKYGTDPADEKRLTPVSDLSDRDRSRVRHVTFRQPASDQTVPLLAGVNARRGASTRSAGFGIDAGSAAASPGTYGRLGAGVLAARSPQRKRQGGQRLSGAMQFQAARSCHYTLSV
jgi:hypothetical protein